MFYLGNVHHLPIIMAFDLLAFDLTCWFLDYRQATRNVTAPMSSGGGMTTQKVTETPTSVLESTNAINPAQHKKEEVGILWGVLSSVG